MGLRAGGEAFFFLFTRDEENNDAMISLIFLLSFSLEGGRRVWAAEYRVQKHGLAGRR